MTYGEHERVDPLLHLADTERKCGLAFVVRVGEKSDIQMEEFRPPACRGIERCYVSCVVGCRSVRYGWCTAQSSSSVDSVGQSKT